MMGTFRYFLHTVFSLLLLSPNLTWGQRTPVFGLDRFGYQGFTGASCPQQWLDISGTGAAVALQAVTADPAADEGGAIVDLSEGFEFYGRVYQRVVLSSNGYLSFADDLLAENGADFSNDCPLPAVPDNGAAQLGRIALFHDDLQAGAGGEVYHAYLAPCPRAGALPDEACTVVQWQQWDYHNQSGASLNFQVLLYHQSRAIVGQYQLPAGFDTSSVTLGIQAPDLKSALTLSCNTAESLPLTGAWCTEYPFSAEQLLANGFEQ